MEYNENSYYPGQNPGDGQPKRKKPQNRGLWKLLWLVPVILIIAGLAMDSFYTLTEDQYAVITTFGKPTTVSASGLQMKIPLVQQVRLVSKSIQGFPLGYRTDSSESVDDESLMITYDYNFVNVDFYVEYRVTDPVKYLYNSSDPVGILKMLCQSYIRDTIGLYDVDSVITTGKSEIQSEIKQKVMNRLEQEDLGIQLTNLTIQDAEPPTLDRESKINEAEGQAARFTELFAEYQNYPLITKQRLFYEAMEEILPDMKLYIVDANTGVQTALPLESFANVNMGTTEGGAANCKRHSKSQFQSFSRWRSLSFSREASS